MNKNINRFNQKQFSWIALLRASIISLGAAVPLMILYLFIYMYIPGNNISLGFYGQIDKPPTIAGNIISLIIGLIFIYMDFLIGRRYYRSIMQSRKRNSPK